MITKRILLVDNEPDANLLFKLVLEENGFKVDSFTDPLVALSNFKPDSYNLAILDIKMPNMDGLELYHEIKKIDDKVKICFLTASEIYYEEFRKQGHYPLDKTLFIRKPIENQELIREINKIMSSC